MGGGNAQKSAMARLKKSEGAASKNTGGGLKGKEARTGANMAEAMAAAQAKREEVRKKREEKK